MTTVLKCLTAWMLLACTTLVQAGFSITGTRVIYQEADGEATVHLRRVTGEKPVLLQVWLDDGSPNVKPGSQDLPFMLTPAVSRVDPDQAQVIRILRIRDDVPGDRESLLFFNALEVPPAAETAQAGENQLHLAMQARMKFFYRPRGLKPSVAQAADLLRFTLDATNDGSMHLRVHNPTPYHVTMPELALYAANAAPDAQPLAKVQANGVAPMVVPFDDLPVPLVGFVPPNTTAVQVRYTVINDQGGFNTKQKALSHGP